MPRSVSLPNDGYRSALIDRLRSASVVSIIVLHVMLSTSGRSHIPQELYHSWYHKLTFVLSSIFSNETLVFISLMLALPKLATGNFREFLLARFARIGIPFLSFTIFYVLLDAFWQRQGVLFKFPLADSVLLLSVAGLGEYHLHFLPALLVLVVISPIFLWELPLYVIVIALLIGTIARFLTEYIVLADQDVATLTASQLLLLHWGKLTAYLPFGFLAGWFVSDQAKVGGRLSGQGMRVLLVAVLFGLAAINLWLMSAPSVDAYGRLEFRIIFQQVVGALSAVAGIFLIAAYSRDATAKGSTDPGYAEFYSRAFLLLLVHPIFLKMFMAFVLVRQPILTDLLCVLFVLSASWATAGVMLKGADWVRRRHFE